MTSPDPIVLCTYRYDPLDRLASSSPVGQADIQRFYQKNRLATEIEGALQRTVFQHEDLLLAQQRHVDGVVNTTLLATDPQRSVLRLVDKSGIEPVAYSAYGHHPAESGLTSLLGFNGERRDSVTGHYLLGNGYRAYNPVLMRFNSPDSLSPFDEGGLNAYGYCGGDPVGFVDETGHGKFKVITQITQLVLNRARPSVIVRAPPIMKKGSSRLIASVPSSVEANYAYSSSAAVSSGSIPSVSPASVMDPAHAALGPYSTVGRELRVLSKAEITEKLSDLSYLNQTRSWVDRKASPVVPKKPEAASKRLELHERKVEGASILYEFYREKARSGGRVSMYSMSEARYQKTLNEHRDLLKDYKKNYNIAHPSEIRDV
ncbi:RHS repeat-associated core domain-containing protein [Pseudomonas syringae]|uniref:RHS repeat-associated core domain-containing protein n=1 Tax=Pseudomonas syringae TaxID=317 RepID=UPI001F2455E0|nr:RHS repeat-associated core domain-containing protein [Pseudomonas syringae]MCF8985028.1 RHS repeat-associated core domain-containing protein [Pseudomonas syringae]